MKRKVTVHIFQDQKRYPINCPRIKTLVLAFFRYHRLTHDEVTIHFVTKQRIGKVHAIHFNDPSPTDCISFPMDTDSEIGYKVLGEIFVCPAVASEYANDHQIDFHDEVELYVVHGLLHLIGYDDLTSKDAAEMRKEETKFITYFRKQNK